MSVRSIADDYMKLCNEGKHFDFMRRYYAPQMVSVEADGREFVGKDPVIRKSEVFQSNHDFHSQVINGPFFLGDPSTRNGRFAVHFTLEYSPKAGGQRARLEEVGVYTVKDDIVTREEFFYDGKFI